MTGMGNSSKVILGLILGGMMTIDMGGPFNKAAYVFGTAVAGAISMFFNCTLMAPHGGIFVFPVVGNALMYLVALVVGTLISAMLLGVLKKKVA